MKQGRLRFWDVQHIMELLDDPVLLRIWLMDGDKAKHLTVSVNGKLTFGRTKYAWLNWMFKDTKEISFTDFAFKTADALAGQAKNRNDVTFYGISQVVLDNAIKDDNYTYCVDALYDTFRHGWDGSGSSQFVKMRTDAPPPDLPAFKGRFSGKDRSRGNQYYGDVRLNSGELLGIVGLEHVSTEYR